MKQEDLEKMEPIILLNPEHYQKRISFAYNAINEALKQAINGLTLNNQEYQIGLIKGLKIAVDELTEYGFDKISGEEIDAEASKYSSNIDFLGGFVSGAKWYKEMIEDKF